MHDLMNTLFDCDWLESHTGLDCHTLTKCSFGVYRPKVIMFCVSCGPHPCFRDVYPNVQFML